MFIFEIFGQFPTEFPVIQTVISALVAFVLGIVWYNPTLMGEKAAEEHAKVLNGYKPGLHVYVIALLLWVLSACVYSFLMSFLTPPSIQSLLGLSTFLWIGFVLPAILLNGMFSGKNFNVMAIDSSYFLASFYLFAVIHNVI
jgi:hypothetical protein